MIACSLFVVFFIAWAFWGHRIGAWQVIFGRKSMAHKVKEATTLSFPPDKSASYALAYLINYRQMLDNQRALHNAFYYGIYKGHSAPLKFCQRCEVRKQVNQDLLCLECAEKTKIEKW